MDADIHCIWRKCVVVGWLLLVVVASGCRTPARVTHFARELAQDAPAVENSFTRQVPVIDVHTHNFNAKDIPVRNIALARRDALPPWTWLVTDTMAKLLAAAIVNETQPEDQQERVGEINKGKGRSATAAARAMGLPEKPATNITNRSQFSAVEKALTHAKTGTNAPLHIKESVVLRSVAAITTHKPVGFLKRDEQELLEMISPFLADLTLSHENLARAYWEQNPKDVQFRIVHMMDMGPTYGQEPAKGILQSFSEQIAQMAEFQRDPAARMAYFVAYNPFRDNRQPGEALQLVQRALTEQKAYGVKLYPPAGYRPIGNQIPKRPWALFTDEPGMQWDYRYKQNNHKISGFELDQRLLKLLCWCAANDIPVFVHSGHGEFQARSGYGQDMPNPRWWKRFLESQSEANPELKTLRLCFGHAGGAGSFFGIKGFKEWSKIVAELCRNYPNIYCEVGCLDQILDTKQQAEFATSLDKMCHLPTSPNQANFGKKIIYGSDWFMPIAKGVDRNQFFEAYQKVFRLPELREFYQDFFLRNALAFLNAEQRLRDGRFPLEEQTKLQLKQLLARASQEERR